MFFLPTACMEERRVLSVHKNHFLMAALEFDEYRQVFLRELKRLSPEAAGGVDAATAARTYRWDTPEVAAFKFLLNFSLAETVRDAILDSVFAEYLGDEHAFADELYLTWEEAARMQSAGMMMGGHSHRHTALATLDDDRQRADLTTCTDLLRRRLKPQALWPFSYPYGRRQIYNAVTVRSIRDLGYCCAFGTEVGSNPVGQDVFALRRIDTKDVP